MSSTDRFRSPHIKDEVVHEFNDDVRATIEALKISGRKGKKERAQARRTESQQRKHDGEHQVAKWDTQKSGNLWQMIPAKPRLFKREELLNAVEGEYMEPVCAAHACLVGMLLGS